jgi:hypothetical protein
MPYRLIKTDTGYKVCLKAEPSKCFSHEGLPLERAQKQMKAIIINEKEGGRRGETVAQSRAREAQAQTEFEQKNKEAKAKAEHITGIQSSIAKKTRQQQRTEIMKGDLKNKLNSYKRVLDSIADQMDTASADKISEEYKANISRVENFDFYKITNPALRDQLDKQYMKMWTNMKMRPRVYGMLPENKNGELGTLADPRYIRYIYEHYGQGERTFLDTIASGLEMAVSLAMSELPIIGDVYEAGMDIVHSKIDKEDEPIEGEEAGDVDYTVLDKSYEEQMAQAEEQRKQLEASREKYSEEQKQIEGELGGIVDTELTPEEIEYQAQSMKGYGKPADTKLYEKIKKKVYKAQPTHSLFRSARIQKEYKDAGGTYIGDKPGKDTGLKGWFDNKWISMNDYVRGDIVPCGSARTEENYGEYPLCRPLKVAKKLGKEKIKKLIKVKDDLEEKPLIVEKVLGTRKYNIKPSMSGGDQHTKSNNFMKQLKEIDLSPEDYMKMAKYQAKQKGYDPELLFFSVDGDHKLVYDSPEGLRRFGKVGYGDFIIWTWLEKKGKVPKGTASKKRNVFHKSHRAMTDKYKLGKYSENELALNINW